MEAVISREVREFDGVRVDTSDWPLIVMEFPPRRIPETALRDSLAYLEALFVAAAKVGDKTFQITDLSLMEELAPASHRRYAVEWMRRTLHLQRAASLGGANVTPSAVLRGLITAIHWLQPPPTPTSCVATRPEAEAVALRALNEAHATIRPEVRARLEGKSPRSRAV